MRASSSTKSLIIAAIGIAALLFGGISALGMSFAFADGDPGEPTIPVTGGDGTISGCGIPDSYATVLNQAVSGTGVSPALIAAIFYAGEHASSWPNIEGPWDSSGVGASGPFQFMPKTWDGQDNPDAVKSPPVFTTDESVIKNYGGYGRDADGGGADVQNINDAAEAAATMFKANLATQSGTEEEKIRKAIYLYNHDDSYVTTVYAAYEKFLICASGDILNIIGNTGNPTFVGNAALPIEESLLGNTSGQKYNGSLHNCSVSLPTGCTVAGHRVMLGSLSKYNVSWAGTKGEGVDLAAPGATPVYAPFDGKVVFSSGASSLGETGGFIVILSTDEKSAALLAHLQNFSGINKEVTAGQKVGELKVYSGSLGPHLHFELWVDLLPINAGTTSVTPKAIWEAQKKALGKL